MNISKKTITVSTAAALVGLGLASGGYAAGQAHQPEPDVLDVSALGAGPGCEEIPEPDDPRGVRNGIWPNMSVCDKLGAVVGLRLDDPAPARWAVFWAGDKIRSAQLEIADIAGDSSLDRKAAYAQIEQVNSDLNTELAELTYPAVGYIDKTRLY